MRWAARPSDGIQPDLHTFIPAQNLYNYPFAHALATMDDLSSMRVAIHKKDLEEEMESAKVPPPITKNKIGRGGIDTCEYADDTLSDHLEQV